MKTKIFFGIALFAITCLIPVNALAQEKINAFVKKCETMDNVDINIIQERDKKTKVTTKVIKSITIKNNKALVDEALSAFAQDKKDAYKIIENKQRGKIIPNLYQFSDGKTNTFCTINLHDDNGTGANITVIERPEAGDD